MKTPIKTSDGFSSQPHQFNAVNILPRHCCNLNTGFQGLNGRSYLPLGNNESILTLHDSILCSILSMRYIRQGDVEKCQFSHKRSQEKPYSGSPRYYFSHNTGYVPLFEKLKLCHFVCTKGLHEYLFSLTEKNWKRIFTFTKEAGKENSICFASILTEAARTLGIESSPTKLCSQEASQHLSIKLP